MNYEPPGTPPEERTPLFLPHCFLSLKLVVRRFYNFAPSSLEKRKQQMLDSS